MLATVAAYTDGEPWLDRLLATLASGGRCGHPAAGPAARGRLAAARGNVLAWLDCSALGPDDEARERFLARGRVALEPGLRFGAAGSGYARLNFATSADVLDEATTRMAIAAAGR